MIELLNPWFLLLAALLPIAAWRRRRRGAPALSFATGSFTSALPRSPRTRWIALPRVLRILGLLLVVIALARPAERERLPEEFAGIDILLCIDVSSSMTANDLDTSRSRLAVAKAAAAQFIAGRPHDRIGLIQFARFPDVVCPVTLDHLALTRFLAAIEPVEPDGEEDRTGIGTAVARAAQALRDSDARSRVVVLLTDGEENVATAETPDEIGPIEAARMCEELGVQVYTIVAGFGRRGPRGEWRPIDTRSVKRLAEITGGRFFTARDADAVGAVYASIDALEKVRFEEPRYVWIDRFLPILLAAVALLLIGRSLESAGLEVSP